MIVASSQPVLLPYSGFWHKMAKADVFDLRIFDPFQPRSSQRQTIMRGKWASLPVVVSPGSSRICDVRLLPVETANLLSELIVDRYSKAKHWDRYGPQLLDMIDGICTEHLWQFNLQLILGIRELLGITTPISIASPPTVGDGKSLVSTLKQYSAATYLASAIGHPFVDGGDAFGDGGIDIVWSTHRPSTADSIISVLMDYDDPLGAVMAEGPARTRRPRS